MRRRPSRLVLVAGLVALAAVVAYAAGLRPPNLEQLLLDAGRTLGSATYIVVGALVFLETGAFLGFLLPGETAIMVGGLFAGQGRIALLPLVGVVWACALAGDLLGFGLGRRFGRGLVLRHGSRVKITPARFERVEAFFQRRGGAAIVLGRWVDFVRPMMPFVAGSSGMPLGRFLAYDVIGAGVWGAGYVLLGYLFWRSFDQVASWAARGALALAVVLVAAAGLLVAARPLGRRLRRVLVPAWERVPEPLRRAAESPLGTQVAAAATVAAVGGWTFATLLDEVLEGEPLVLDEIGGDAAGALDAQAVLDVAQAVTALGGIAVLGPVTAAAALLLLRRGRRLEAGILASGLAALQLFRLVKALVERPRPPDPVVAVDGFAFPSGHATQSVLWPALALALALLLEPTRARALLVAGGALVAVAVGLTRFVLRVHVLTDVLAGWALGAMLLALCAAAWLLARGARKSGLIEPGTSATDA